MPESPNNMSKGYQKKTMDELSRLALEEHKLTQKTNLCLVLDNVRSLQNVGSIFRTSDAFNIKKIYLCGITGTPPNKDIDKSALGACESVAWEYFASTEDAVRYLKSEQYVVMALEQTHQSVSLENIAFNKHTATAIILGNEVFGVDEEVLKLVDHVIEIPQFGTKHSLNVAVSTGMLVWDYYSKTKV